MKSVLFGQAHEKDKCIIFATISSFMQSCGYECYHLAFNRYEKKIYEDLNVKNIIFLPNILKNKSKADELDIDYDYIMSYIVDFNKINNYIVDKEKYRKSINKIWNYLENNNFFSKIITWNDTFLYDRLLKCYSNKKNIERIVIEDGIFRPNTITLDSEGVNFNNSIPKSRNFYEKIVINSNRYNKYLDTIEDELKLYSINNIKLKQNYKIYKIIDLFGKILKPSKDLSYIESSIIDKIKYNKNKEYIYNEEFNLDKKYIFIPFQVHDDSQIIEFSPYIRNMEELVRIINEVSIEINKFLSTEILFVFKEHPADNGRINYDNLYLKYKSNKYLVFLKNIDTKYLIKNSEAVITVNSTVGIESLKLHKKVITLGNAYYNIEGIAYNYDFKCNLAQYIIDIINLPINISLIDKFMYYLRFEYQIEANWRSGKINGEQLKRFI